MPDEQTDAPDTKGKETDKPAESDEKPISEYDKTLALVKRREEASKVEAELLDRKEKLQQNALLSGEGGGTQTPVEPKEETSKEYRERVEKEVSEGKHND